MWLCGCLYDCESTEHEHDSDRNEGQRRRVMQRAYRAAAARCNYVGMDRPDFQYASKEAARRMTSLVQHGHERVERMGKYLNGAAGMMVQESRGEHQYSLEGNDGETTLAGIRQAETRRQQCTLAAGDIFWNCKVTLDIIPRKCNMTDMMTHALPWNEILKHMTAMGFVTQVTDA